MYVNSRYVITMNKFLLLLLLTSCGTERPCDAADLNSYGLCFVTNNKVLDHVMLNDTMTAFEEYLHDFGFNLDLESFNRDNEVIVYYKDPQDQTLKRKDDEGNVYYIRGSAGENNIYLGKSDNCVDTYYVLTHELMHVIARYYLDVDKKLNSNHDVKHLFLTWAVLYDEPLNSTVEYFIYLRVKRLCEELEG